jgi:hypothetical protein
MSVRPALLTAWAPRYGPSWPRVMSSCAHSLFGIMGTVLGPHPHVHSGWRRYGPLRDPALPSEAGFASAGSGEVEPSPRGQARLTPSPLGSCEAEPPLKGSGKVEPTPLWLGEMEPVPLGLGETKSTPEGSDETIVMPLIVQDGQC